MKTLKLFLVFGLIMALFMTPLKAQWTEAYNNPGAFFGFHFTDSLNGWFSHIGSQKIIHTSDGGYTFDVQLNVALPFNMYDVYMEDNLNGWACGGNSGSGPIYRTTNGGINWVQMTHPASQSIWGQIIKVGSSIWIVGSYDGSFEYLLILKTSNGGTTWDLEQFPQHIGGGIHAFNSLNFIVYGVNGTLDRTTDGGNSWISANLPSDYQVEKVKFLDDNLGYALVSNVWSNHPDAYLYRTADGGFTWNLHYSWIDQGQKEGLSINPQTGSLFVTGNLSGTLALNGILKSTDNGSSWNILMEVMSDPLIGIATPDQHHGWIGGAGKIYRYDYVEPPVVQPIPNALIQMGTPFQYQVQASGLGLKYTMSGQPVGLTIGYRTGLIAGTPTQGGSFPITVTVKDTDINVVNTQFNLRVNRQPVFIPPWPPTHAWVDSSYQVQLNVEDADDDTVSFSWLAKPSWLTFLTEGISSVVISGTPSINDTGSHPVSVLADDGYGGQDTLSWVIQVELYVPPINHAPQFVGSWPDTLYCWKDSSYTWNFLFQDMDGDTLFTLPGDIGVPGMQLMSGSGVGEVTAVVTGQTTDTGWFTALISVKDEHGAQGSLQFTVYVDYITGVEPNPVPTEFVLEQNYPNPFNPVTKIKFTIPASPKSSPKERTFVQLIVYDLLGREAAVLVNEEKQPGVYEEVFDGSNLPSGVYLYRLTAGDPSTGSGQGFSDTKKLVLLK